MTTNGLKLPAEIEGFDWDDGNRDKCRKYGMTLVEIESVFGDAVVVLPDKENQAGEQRFRAIGRTATGRSALIVALCEIRAESGFARSAHVSRTRRKCEPMKKRIPTFETDEQAEEFVANSDLSQYDLSGGQVVRFELKRKDKPITLRLPSELLDAVRERAERIGVPYQRFIRMAVERALQETK
jgi:predicted DNA binding CopG/RHH family protein/uncharacterized DUF497 family protein